MSFRQELTDAINRCSAENGSNTPDFILAEYLLDCLNAYENAVSRRDRLLSGKLGRYAMKKKYNLGNSLRGSFYGKFNNHTEAWKALTAQFERSYPSESKAGRYVELMVWEANQYRFEQWITCRVGTVKEAVN